MNGTWLDRTIARLSPSWGLRRWQARALLSYYDGTKFTRLRQTQTSNASPDTVNQGHTQNLRGIARDLERNLDIARGAIGVLVQNTVGPHGILVEPQPKRSDGTIHNEFATAIERLWNEWQLRPEVTWELDWPAAQRLLARSWFRDGDSFVQMLTGNVPLLDHGTAVPFSLELLEADMVPDDFNDATNGIVQGVKKNAWGRPSQYLVYKTHPGDVLTGTFVLSSLKYFKRIPGERMLHMMVADRIRQTRGISHFASVLTRLQDVKDYEESERIAAKVAASMAAYIKKGLPELYNPDTSGEKRNMKFRPGMVFDDLTMGEDIGTIDSKRPNPNVESYRAGQLRAAASGLTISYSSLSKNYDGNYSSQRQELVEQWGAYGILCADFISRIARPVYATGFIEAALLSGKLVIPRDVVPATINDSLFIGPQMPWIDPAKEATAWKALEDQRYASGPEIIRKRGRNPRQVVEEEENWRKLLDERDIQLETPPTNAYSNRSK